MYDLTGFVIEKLSVISGLAVRGVYDTRKPVYPIATVMQMDNSEAIRYTTIDNVERVSVVPFQIDVYCRASNTGISAAQEAERYRMEIDLIMQSECGMRRTSAPPIIPHAPDNTVMRAIARYDCSLQLDTGVIFKR